MSKSKAENEKQTRNLLSMGFTLATYLIVGPIIFFHLAPMLGHPLEITLNNYVITVVFVAAIRVIATPYRPEDFDLS